MTDVVAHRTCPLDAPENSREGVAFAAGAGADVVEIDLRLSRDRVPVLSHDPFTFRTTWWPLVVGWTPSSWLTRLRLRDSHETLPAFADILAVLPDGVDLAVDVLPSSVRPVLRALARAGATAVEEREHEERDLVTVHARVPERALPPLAEALRTASAGSARTRLG